MAPDFHDQHTDALASGDTRTLDEVLTEWPRHTETVSEDLLIEALRYACGQLPAKERARVLELLQP